MVVCMIMIMYTVVPGIVTMFTATAGRFFNPVAFGRTFLRTIAQLTKRFCNIIAGLAAILMQAKGHCFAHHGYVNTVHFRATLQCGFNFGNAGAAIHAAYRPMMMMDGLIALVQGILNRFLYMIVCLPGNRDTLCAGIDVIFNQCLSQTFQNILTALRAIFQLGVISPLKGQGHFSLTNIQIIIHT